MNKYYIEVNVNGKWYKVENTECSTVFEAAHQITSLIYSAFIEYEGDPHYRIRKNT